MARDSQATPTPTRQATSTSVLHSEPATTRPQFHPPFFTAFAFLFALFLRRAPVKSPTRGCRGPSPGCSQGDKRTSENTTPPFAVSPAVTPSLPTPRCSLATLPSAADSLVSISGLPIAHTLPSLRYIFGSEDYAARWLTKSLRGSPSTLADAHTNQRDL